MSKLHSLTVTAKRLGVPADWLASEARDGNVPCLKAGRSLLFDPDAVERLLMRRAGTLDSVGGTTPDEEPDDRDDVEDDEDLDAEDDTADPDEDGDEGGEEEGEDDE